MQGGEDRPCKPIGSPWWDEPPGLAVDDDVRQAADTSCYRRYTEQEGLDRPADVLGTRWMNGNIHVGIQLRNVLTCPQEDSTTPAAPGPVGADPRLVRGRIPPSTSDEDAHEVGLPLLDDGDRID